MYEIFIGSLVLSTIHALIPNHWLPIIAIGKTEGWSGKRSLWAAVITGAAHTLSTILIGIAVGLAGYKLANNYDFISGTIAPSILLGLGIIYVIMDIRGRRHHHHSHFEAGQERKRTGKSTWIAILTSLSIAMFLTPCIEIEAYYFHAGAIGWLGIIIVSSVYLLVTILVMMILVYLGMKGISTFKTHFLEHHEKLVTGLVLIGLGILAMMVKF
jgi:hypothetical protein